MTPAREPTVQASALGVRTLRGAQEWLTRQWPGTCSTTAALRAYHQAAAELYRQIASTEPAHHHEALFWAQQERDAAQALADLITPAEQ